MQPYLTIADVTTAEANFGSIHNTHINNEDSVMLDLSQLNLNQTDVDRNNPLQVAIEDDIARLHAKILRNHRHPFNHRD